MSFQNPLPAGIRQVVPDYVSDGATTVLGFPFRLWNAVDLFVGWGPLSSASKPFDEGFTPLVLGRDYTVAINGVSSATVTLNSPQPLGTLVRVFGLRTPSRLTSVVNDGALQSAPFESELDCVEATLQEVRRDVLGAFSAVDQAETLLASEIAQVQVGLAAEIVRAEAEEFALANSIGVLAAPGISAALGIANPSLLPTALPVTPGTYWLDGNVLCVTPGGTSPLPTARPSTPGYFWSNGGVVCVS